MSKYTEAIADVLGHGRGVLELKLYKEESKYTEATAEVYLSPSESTLLQSQWCTWLGRGVLELKLQEEENNYTKAIAEVCLFSSESKLLRSRPSKHPQL